ncbi:MAG: SDR family NAD(P)-dependent oxidoreductase [Actinomycetota bacterium]|nr:SDR family NAD(P)-dependent oxidoreductase [Actinomycetota bacterium]
MPRTAVITGGTGGLGAAVTHAFLGAGWRVVVPYLEPRELERVREHERLELVAADLSDPAAVAAVMGAAGDSLGALVNLVGGFHAGDRIHEEPIETFEAQLRLNLRPTYLACAAAIPAMLAAGEGAIVCVSSRAALQPFPGAAAYATAKAAVLAFVDALHVEYNDDGIRANAIVPSIIDTPANRASMPDADPGTWVRPEEIAQAILFLCSPEASALGGAHVPVYGRA